MLELQYAILGFIILIAIFIFVVIVSKFSKTKEGYEGVYEGGYKARKTYKNNNKKDVIKDLDKHPRSKSEHELILVVEKLLGCKMPTVNPNWLTWEGKTLELDGYCASRGIAIEFSGPQHTKWFPEKESYLKYYNRVVKDIVKKKLCKRKKVLLVVIDMRLPKHHWKDYLQSRLWEWNPEEYSEPLNFIIEQIEKPYRNKVIEAEMGLKSINVAKRL